MAKQVYEEQLSNGYPGLVKETKEICDHLGIMDITKERVKEPSKPQWKGIIKEAVEEKNGLELKERICKLKKLEVMKEEKYGRKQYLSNLSMENARMLFRVRTKTFKCKMNQSSDRANSHSLWKCGACGYIETQSHIIHCPAYQHLREGKNIDSDQEVAEYFREVLKIKDNKDI